MFGDVDDLEVIPLDGHSTLAKSSFTEKVLHAFQFLLTEGVTEPKLTDALEVVEHWSTNSRFSESSSSSEEENGTFVVRHIPTPEVVTLKKHLFFFSTL